MKESEYIRIEVKKEKHLLYTQWLRDATSQELRAGVLEFVRIIQQEDIWYWILDAHLVRSPSITDQQWMLKEVTPLLTTSNLRKLARIGSSDVFQYLTYENIADKTQELFTVNAAFAQFTTYQAALDWINLLD